MQNRHSVVEERRRKRLIRKEVETGTVVDKDKLRAIRRDVAIRNREQQKVERAELKALASELEVLKMNIVKQEREKQNKEAAAAMEKRLEAEGRMMMIEQREKAGQLRAEREARAAAAREERLIRAEALAEERVVRKNIVLMQHAFSAWHARFTAAEARAKRARTTILFRQKNRIWRAWKSYVDEMKSVREEVRHQMALQREAKLSELATTYYNHGLLRRVLLEFVNVVKRIAEDKRLDEERKARHFKIEALAKAMEERIREEKERKEKEKKEKERKEKEQKQLKQRTLEQFEKVIGPMHTVAPPKPANTGHIITSERDATGTLSVRISSTPKRKAAEKVEAKTEPIEFDPAAIRLEERALARKKKREELKLIYEEKSKKKEEERIRAEMEKTKQLEEENRHRLEERRRERREKKMAKERLEKLREDRAAKNALADEHYTRSIMKFYGFLPWKKILSIGQSQRTTALLHCFTTRKKKAVGMWCAYVAIVKKERTQRELMNNVIADRHSLLVAKRMGWVQWRKVYKSTLESVIVADEHHRKNALKKALNIWSTRLAEYRDIMLIKESQQSRVADAHYMRSLLHKYLASWKSACEEAKEERSGEERRKQMRSKVDMWIAERRAGRS